MIKQPLCYFVHIPKTAGEVFKRNIETSLRQDQFIRTSFSYDEPFFNIHTQQEEFLKNHDYCYITFFREPSARTVSLYQELGVHCFDADRNASTPFITLDMLDRQTLAKLREINAHDHLLYQLALEENRGFKAKTPQFISTVHMMQKKKKRQLQRKKVKKPFLALFNKFSNLIKKLLKKSSWIKKLAANLPGFSPLRTRKALRKRKGN
jgi:hypothetical protein